MLETAPNYRIGTSQRVGERRKDSPGPGAYDYSGEYEGPKWGFGSDSRNKDIAKNEGPGPGTYKAYIIKDTKAFSMSPRHPNAAKSLSPGPGTYNPALKKETPLFSIGKGPRESLKNKVEVPGPGTYQSRTWTEEFSNATKFGTDNRRPISSVSAVPGPGAYVTTGRPGEGPAFTMRSRTAKIKRQEVPVNSK